MKCDFCGVEESLPFVCNYCGGTYCSEHRLPESHKCIGDLTRRPVAQSTGQSFSWKEGGYTAGRQSLPIKFSPTEVRDILVAWIALSVAFTAAITGGFLSGFSDKLFEYSNGTGGLTLEETFGIALVTIGVGFVLHELMHKFIAERYGFMAEFRMWVQGLVFALVTALLAGIVFAAPGATYIMGSGIDKKENGVISLAGPLTNIVIGLLFIPVLLFGDNSNNLLIYAAGYLGSYFNFFLALFNMLPIFVLDGAKVWRWNKPLWAAVFVPLVIVWVEYAFFGWVP